MSRSMVFVCSGASSGSASSLRHALRGWLDDVDQVDLSRVTRHPLLLGHRLMGELEAKLFPDNRATHLAAPWNKTRSWAAGTRSFARRARVFDGRHILFMQTLAPWRVPSHTTYSVYTDRVYREGRDVGTAFASNASTFWMRREREFLQRATVVFVAAHATERYLIDHYGIEAASIEVVGGGPNTSIATISAFAPQRLIFIGRQWQLHGGPLMVEAVRGLAEKFSDIDAVIAGSSPHLDEPVFTVVGKVGRDEIRGLLLAGGIYVRPSLQDAFPKASIEAILAGIPVVGSGFGGHREIIGDAGVVLEDLSPSAVSNALAEVLSDYQWFRTRALERREEMREYWDWRNTAKRIIDRLEQEQVLT